MCRLRVHVGVIGLIGLLAFGCGDPCSEIASSLRSCGLLTAGEYSCTQYGDDVELECAASCVSRANCAQRKASVCSSWSNTSYDVDSAITGCISRCLSPTIVCDDGEVVVGARCDWDTDCGDGSDELGCAEFACKSGYQWVPDDVMCDGYINCDDGSDESSETCSYSWDQESWQEEPEESFGPQSCMTSEGLFGMIDCLGFCRYEALDDWGDDVCDPWLNCAEWSYDLSDCESGDVDSPAASAMVVCGSD